MAAPDIRRISEEIMPSSRWIVSSPYARRGVVEMILEVLDVRGIEVSDGVRTRLSECEDGEQLKAWHRRAVFATSIDELFDQADR